MRKKGLLLLICLLCLGMLFAVCWSVIAQQQSFALLNFRAGDMELGLYRDQEQEKYCLFLPSFSEKETLSATHSGAGTITFTAGSETYSALSQVPLEQDVTMTISFPWGTEEAYTLRLMQCSARQTISIQTKDGTMSQIDTDQSNEASVAITIRDARGKTTYQGHGDISGRGNGTWNWPKKPYDLKFPEPITVGSLENVDKLCILAEYCDYSKLRNALAYHAGQLLEIPYASGYEFADVYIDGVYNGIYGLTTKREYTKHIRTDGIQSVFELSTSYKGNFFYTDYHTQIRIHQGTQDAVLYSVEVFEEALHDRDWETLWNAADLQSWARKYALDEFLYNYDLPLTSQYFYVDGDGKIKCMLPWDYEWIFYPRLSPYDFNQEPALAAHYYHGNWYEILLECEDFRLAVAEVLREEFTSPFFSSLETHMNACIQELTGSWHCDYYRWNADYAANPGTDGGLAPMTRHAQIFRSNFDSRKAFLLSVLENWDDYRVVLFFQEIDGELRQSNLQIMAPVGTPMETYYQNIQDTLTNLAGIAPISCTTEDGIPLESVKNITENMMITVVYPPESY